MESRHGLHPADRPFSLAVRDRFGKSKLSGWRLKIYEVIFESDTPLGKGFDVALIVVILLSVIAVMLESIAEFRNAHLPLLRMAEWVFTIVFTLEYIVRLICVGKPLRYAFSFFGIVDFLAVIPTYLSLLVPGAQYLLIIRLLRVLRIFRVLKLAAYLSESTVLAQALRASRRKIEIFIFTVLTLVVILGSIMYLVEGEENGFTSIPRSIYWAIVTLTTVGYGDISPQTDLGQTLAAFIMIIGYAIIAVPTGIVTAEITRAELGKKASVEEGTRALICPTCYAAGHDEDARFCKNCGSRL
jgi:voltage-gated potassium channel